MTEDETLALVLQNGEQNIKFGYAGDEEPRTVLNNYAVKDAMGEFTFGIPPARPTFQVLESIVRGHISNWDILEKVWLHSYTLLKVNPEDHPLLITDVPLTPKETREKMTQILFETFNVPCYYVANQSVLVVYASGRTTGVVLDSGHGITHAVPILDGYAVPQATTRMNIGGRDVSQFIGNMFSQKQINLNAQQVNDIKIKYCHVTEDYSEALKIAQKLSDNASYTLPDGSKIPISVEKFTGPELLFEPQIAGYRLEGVHKYVFRAIQNCEVEQRKELYNSVILAGGNTMFPGMTERLWQELHSLAPSTCKLKMLAPPERTFSVWQGGSVLGSLSAFQQMWISKQEYDESGPAIVHRKCF